jgi:hypothetical protein
MYVSGLKALMALSLKLIKPPKKNPKIVEQQLLEHFKNAELQAASTSINNIFRFWGGNRTGKDI